MTARLPVSAGLSRRALLAAGAASVAPTAPSPSAGKERRPDPLVLDDASRLNPTRVFRHIVLEGPDSRVVAEVRRALAEAEAENRPVVLGGARHSMGGQSLYANGSALTAVADSCETDSAARTCHVSAGARWKSIVPRLDRLGLSVAVMQSNSDFSVGGTLSVNGHGWAVPFGAFASTVRSFRLILADGTLITCSRHENTELFRAAIGGYGLLGVVVDAELDVAANTSLTPRLATMRAADLASRFTAAIDQNPKLSMAYARLSVAPSSFLQEGLLVTFAETSATPAPLSTEEARLFGLVSRTILRAQTGSDKGKAARWWAETKLAPRLAPATVSRNQLLMQPVSALGDPGAGRTDILHEYFLPPSELARFLDGCRKIIPAGGPDLLNVTLRYVASDPVSLLSFAPEPRIAAVMLFSQARSGSADASMRIMTERLVDEALTYGGSFYLPYRLHARRDQVARAYPGLDTFAALKRRHDPKARFRNVMWDAYFA